MQITTKTGDKGVTGLLFGARVSKAEHRIATIGDIDETSAAIGLIKSAIKNEKEQARYLELLTTIQHRLTLFMGEVSTDPSNAYQYLSKFEHVRLADMEQLDEEVELLQNIPELDQKGWVMYGATEFGARCDMAAKICRRAERSFVTTCEEERQQSKAYRPILLQYINRLSDFLYLLARYFDHVYQTKENAHKKHIYKSKKRAS